MCRVVAERCGLSRNDAVKFVRAQYGAAIRGESGEDSDVEEEVFESTIF